MSTTTVRPVQSLATPKPSLEDQLAHLQAENEALRQRMATKTRLTLKVSPKGAVSVYGLGRWPVTMYREQWEKVLAMAQDIQQFLTDNADALASKE